MLTLSEPNSELRIVALQRLAQGGKWRVEAMRSYSRPVLLWFTRGQGRITVAGKTRGYGSHNAIYLPAGTMHGFQMAGPVFGTAIHFPRELSAELPDEPLHLRLRNVHMQASLNALIETMERELAQDLPGRDRALVHHAGLVAVWLERHRDQVDGPQTERAPPMSEQLAQAFAALVERDFRTGKTIEAYAAELGVTPTHLSRVCRSSAGRPASRILQDRVHYEARKMLADTSLPIKDIASALGFRSAAYFTRAFQAQTGATPSAFRKSS